MIQDPHVVSAQLLYPADADWLEKERRPWAEVTMQNALASGGGTARADRYLLTDFPSGDEWVVVSCL